MQPKTTWISGSPRMAAAAIVLMSLLLTLPVAGLAAGSQPPLIPKMLLRLAVDGEPAHVIVVEKATQQLSLYAVDAEGRVVRVEQMACSTGKMDGDKQKSGDMKTPEGVYFITQKFAARELTPLYGIAAYPLDYPHILDRLAGRGGHSIWLHGTDRPLKARDSNGCIALANPDLARLESVIQPKRTAVLVAERCDFVSASEAHRTVEAIDELLAGWRRAIETGSYHDFLALYAPDYLPPIEWWPHWQALRRVTAAAGTPMGLSFGRVDVYRHKGVCVVRLDLEVTTDRGKAGVDSRKLFMAEHGGRLKIVGDEYLQAVAAGSPEPIVAAAGKLATVAETERGIAKASQQPVVVARKAETVSEPRKAAAAAQATTKQATKTSAAPVDRKTKRDDGQEEVQTFVDRWLAAWSSKNIAAYGDCYTGDFSTDGMERKAFIRYKDSLNRKYRFIRVKRGPLTITRNGALATVSFVQHYSSDRFRSSARKTLKLRRESGRWKISAEISRPM